MGRGRRGEGRYSRRLQISGEWNSGKRIIFPLAISAILSYNGIIVNQIGIKNEFE